MARHHPALQRAWDIGGRICDWPPGYLDVLAAIAARDPAPLPQEIREAQAQIDTQPTYRGWAQGGQRWCGWCGHPFEVEPEHPRSRICPLCATRERFGSPREGARR